MWSEVLPAFAWREVLPAPVAHLHVGAAGADARVLAHADGSTRVLASSRVDGGWDIEVPLDGVTWAWVDGDVEQVEWSADAQVALPGVTAVVPTFGRPLEALTQTRALLTCDLVAHVVVVDQDGALTDDPDFARLVSDEPERVRLLSQDNVGGSGGYARGMLESLRWPEDAVFLSDDDAHIDPEDLRRMVVLQSLAARRGERCLVGTGMRSAEQPELLVSLSEHVDRRSFRWGPADGLADPLDLSTGFPEGWEVLVPRHTPSYAAWWGTMLPPGAVAELGLPVPYFLKWDDAEYGLRAVRRGWTVRALPGVAVQHPTWAAKGTASSWASLPMHRNRLATAAAYDAGRGVILDSFAHQVKHVLSLQYPTAELWQHAVRTVLSGPGTWLGSDLRRVRPQAQAILDSMAPTTAPGHASVRNRAPSLARAVTGLWRRATTEAPRRSRVPADAFGWRDGLGADQVLIEAPDGAVGTVLERDPRRARRLLVDIVRSHARLALAWGRLRAAYRTALPATWTEEYWRRTLGLDAESR